MADPRKDMGYEVHDRVHGPFSIRAAARDGTGNDGGVLDRAIVAQTKDGTCIIIGEIWAACPNEHGGKTRIDAHAVAEAITQTLNRGDV